MERLYRADMMVRRLSWPFDLKSRSTQDCEEGITVTYTFIAHVSIPEL